MNISSVVITKNEEKNLDRCIKSLLFCDEIIIVDDYSDDCTSEIVKKYETVKVYKRELKEDFSDQKNFGLKKAKNKWVLFIDADEEITLSLRNEIIQVTSDPLNTKNGFYLKRSDLLYGKELQFGEWGNRNILRLIRNGTGQWERKVHETLKVKDDTSVLKSKLLHYSHRSIKEFINDINYFSKIHAKSNNDEGKKANLFKIIIYPIIKFINNWLIKGGFKDGEYGFIMSLMMSFHSFLAWTKLWETKRK